MKRRDGEGARATRRREKERIGGKIASGITSSAFGVTRGDTWRPPAPSPGQVGPYCSANWILRTSAPRGGGRGCRRPYRHRLFKGATIAAQGPVRELSRGGRRVGGGGGGGGGSRSNELRRILRYLRYLNPAFRWPEGRASRSGKFAGENSQLGFSSSNFRGSSSNVAVVVAAVGSLLPLTANSR